MTSQQSVPTAPQVLRAPQFFEFSGDFAATAGANGELTAGWRLTDNQHSWAYRAQNVVVEVTWLRENEVLESDNVPDEHVVLVPRETAVCLEPDSGEAVVVNGPALAVLPAGKTRVVGTTSGFVMRVFTTRSSEIVASTFNNAAYAVPDETVRALPPLPHRDSPSGVQLYLMADLPQDAARLGRIFRTESLMINWFEPQVGPRDTEQLSPHSHEDFEQVSVTLAGEYVHHVRRPWTSRLSEWRPDEHVHVHSPSVTIIPPGNIHTTRAIADGIHQLIDVFAPPRQDFIDSGWVLNQSSYQPAE